MLSDEFISALRVVDDHLCDTGVDWFLIGKSNLALQGVNVKPSHLTVLINFHDLEEFLELFSDFSRTDVTGLVSGKAHELTMIINGVSVHVYAEFEDGLYLSLNDTPLRVKAGKSVVNCFSLKAEKEAYTALGDTKTAGLINL